MLHEFVAEHREEIIHRCREKVKVRSIPPPSSSELEFGVPHFLDQLVDALRHQLSSSSAIGRSAAPTAVTSMGMDAQCLKWCTTMGMCVSPSPTSHCS